MDRPLLIHHIFQLEIADPRSERRNEHPLAVPLMPVRAESATYSSATCPVVAEVVQVGVFELEESGHRSAPAAMQT